VGVNDSSLVTLPPTMWQSAERYKSSCGGTRWMAETGESVTLAFIGDSVTVNFLLSYIGRLARVTIDGASIVDVDTWRIDASSSDCKELPWTSPLLPHGSHSITVTAVNANPRANMLNGGGEVYMTSFSYSPSLPAPTRLVNKSNTGVIAGAVVGSVIGVFLLVIGALLLWQRRRRQQEREAAGATKPHSPEVRTTSPTVPTIHTPRGIPWYNTPAYRGGNVQSLEESSQRAPSPIRSASPTLSATSSTKRKLLSPAQLDLVRRLSVQNVPGPTLATIVESMVDGEVDDNEEKILERRGSRRARSR